MGNHSFREPSVDLNAKSFNPVKLKKKQIYLNLFFFQLGKGFLRKITGEFIDFNSTLFLFCLDQTPLGNDLVFMQYIILILYLSSRKY